jgi:hypothetical protein
MAARAHNVAALDIKGNSAILIGNGFKCGRVKDYVMEWIGSEKNEWLLKWLLSKPIKK